MSFRAALALLALPLFTGARAQPIDASDCAYAVTWCTDTSWVWNPAGTGEVADLTAGNAGCLSSFERQGIWVRFAIASAGELGVAVMPNVAGADMDFAVWGPFNVPHQCPTTGPVRCSYAAVPGNTGMSPLFADLTEGAAGNSWVAALPVQAGEHYLLYVSNFSMSGIDIDLSWELLNGATLACQPPPVAAMAVSASLILPGAAVDFTDESTNAPYAWAWTFAGGTPSTSAEQHPADVVFDAPGCHAVTLLVQNAAGSDTITDVCMVEVQSTTGLNAAHAQPQYTLLQDANGILVTGSAQLPLEVTVVDAWGRRVMTTAGTGTALVRTAALATGRYLLLLRSEEATAVRPVLIP